MNQTKGFTLIELLLAVAVVGIILTLALINGRSIVQNSEEQASLTTIQQSFWQGASSASARGAVILLNKNGSELSLKREDNDEVIRTFELSNTVTSNLSDGDIIRFLPPGEIEQSSYDALPNPITLSTSKRNYDLTVSIIGEVKVEEQASTTQNTNGSDGSNNSTGGSN